MELNTDSKIEAILHNVKETDVKENIVNIQFTEDLAANTAISDAEKQNQSTLYTSDIDDSSLSELDYETASDSKEVKIKEDEDLFEKFAKLTCNPTDLKVDDENENENFVDNIFISGNAIKSEDEQSNIEIIGNENYDENCDDDDDGWITPGKLDFITKIF